MLIGVGAILTIGMTGWSLAAGFWTGWRSLACVAGVAPTVAGGVLLQLRLDYRARSKWARETRR